MDGNLLKEKIKEIFSIDIPVSKWFEEEGVDDEEIKKIHREAESIRDRFPIPPKRG